MTAVPRPVVADQPGGRASAGALDRQPPGPVVALLPWGLLLEDFLDPNGLSLDDFCGDFTGSWIFGYAEALRAAGVEPVIFCVVRGVGEVTRRVHGATGTRLCLLPAPPVYRLLRSGMRAPYGRTVAQTFRGPRPLRLILAPPLFALKEAAPFMATPVRALARELRRHRCSALVCQEYEFPRFDVCVALGRLQRIPVFATFQGGDYQRWRLERLTRPVAVRHAAGLVVPSGTEAERVRARYRPPRVARIPNPVDLEIWRPRDRAAARATLGIPAQARVVAWHGRVQQPKKGLDILIDAWSRVATEAAAVLLLVGTGEDAEEVRRLIAGRELADVVWVDRFMHDRAELAGLLAAADVYAFASRHEGFAVSPLEAMACGLPVVSTDVSGIRDLLADGERSGGVIVPREDAERLAQELLRLVLDAPLSRALGQRARARAEAFGSAGIGSRLRGFLFGSAPSRDGRITMSAPGV
jgi:starch synthase